MGTDKDTGIALMRSTLLRLTTKYYIVYHEDKLAVGGVWLNPRKGEAMTCIPLSLAEIVQAILTMILIYVTWKVSSNTRATKK